jgi:hypothetical protein
MTPKNTLTQTFRQHQLISNKLGKPPRPINTTISQSFNGNESLKSQQIESFSNTAPASLNMSNSIDNNEEKTETNKAFLTHISPSPPTEAKTRPNHRAGWSSIERIRSGSLRLSRASTTTSLASDDLEKYMNNNTTNHPLDVYGGSLNNIDTINPNAFMNPNHLGKPYAAPRVSSSNSNHNNNRILSARSQETLVSSASCDAPTNKVPPPIKVKNKTTNKLFEELNFYTMFINEAKKKLIDCKFEQLGE